MFDAPQAEALRTRLVEDLERAAPSMAPLVVEWLESLDHGDFPGYWRRPMAFPLLFLPRWFASAHGRTLDKDFHAEVDYSSLNGYYFIRLIDNVMDGDGSMELPLLPATAFFHSRFQSAYEQLLPRPHDFWREFDQAWMEYASVTVRDALMGRVDLEAFDEVAGRKLAAGKIPIAATAAHYGLPPHQPDWYALVEGLSHWHQLVNDFFDWHHDRDEGIATVIQALGEDRKDPSESWSGWFVRDGFAWGKGLIRQAADRVHDLAERLDCPPLDEYLRVREEAFADRLQGAEEGVLALASLVEAFSPAVRRST